MLGGFQVGPKTNRLDEFQREHGLELTPFLWVFGGVLGGRFSGMTGIFFISSGRKWLRHVQNSAEHFPLGF